MTMGCTWTSSQNQEPWRLSSGSIRAAGSIGLFISESESGLPPYSTGKLSFPENTVLFDETEQPLTIINVSEDGIGPHSGWMIPG
jgi:hypothetical protein